MLLHTIGSPRESEGLAHGDVAVTFGLRHY